MITPRNRYIRREAAVSAAINAVLSAAFTLAVFGVDDIPVWTLPGFVFDFAPQGFAIGFMATLIPELLARRAVVARAQFRLSPRAAPPLRVALLAGLACALLAVAGASALFLAVPVAEVAFWAAVSSKILFGGFLGAVVTGFSLRRLLISAVPVE